jgi:hypothetical protein
MTSLGPVLEAAFAAAGIKRLTTTGADSAQRVDSDRPPEHCELAMYKPPKRRMRLRRM